MIQKAIELKIPCVYLKLDVIKAFDSLEWCFIHRVLDHLGFGELIGDFFLAITTRAQSVVLLNGKKTKGFSISRLVRQGCPH